MMPDATSPANLGAGCCPRAQEAPLNTLVVVSPPDLDDQNPSDCLSPHVPKG